MKKVIFGLVIGLLLGSFSTYLFLDRETTDPQEIENTTTVEDEDYDPYEKTWTGFQIKYTDEWNNGKPFEEQELAFLRDVDYENSEKEPDATKVRVVNYWASYCGPCLKEIPELIKLKNNNIGKASFLAVFPEKGKRKALINIINKTGFNWVQVTDKQNIGNTKGRYPTTMVFSLMDGKLFFKKVGGLNEKDIKEIQRIIDENQ
ncbi:MAG: TlpA family protein disulfide reductase [Bacteroidales bacterium]|jgi:thiol-disulfide isomerase/thioredoxin|nr:TlpA family protein disulfide reductase [Bacteroidales bacterium]